MNLNEAFRYQRYLDSLSRSATSRLSSYLDAYKVIKKHLKSKADPDAEDFEEEVARDEDYNKDDIIKMFIDIIDEKYELTKAINNAKHWCGEDVDAIIQSNKQRREMCAAIQTMLSAKEKVAMELGRGYKFNAEGNQMPYTYDVEVQYIENYDREASKRVLKEMLKTADEFSLKAEKAFISTEVDFTPKFDVNSSFEDTIQEYSEQ